MSGEELQAGDVFTTRRLRRWYLCAGQPNDARGSTIRRDTPRRESFWEVPIAGVVADGEISSDGGYVGVGLRETVRLAEVGQT